MRWQDKLTEKELKHIRVDAGCRTLTQFKQNRKSQDKMKFEAQAKGFGPGIATPCFECEAIARKLGIE